ncbi:hypothetical protein MXB_1986 [Myxobolus squamalis]|nr:hypothetical protein MXB_1986 [Myxobolus squamalis]
MRLFSPSNFAFFRHIKQIRAIRRQLSNGQNFIDNEFIKSTSGNTYSRKNPICDTIIGEYANSTTEDTNLAINAASRSFLDWKATPLEANLFFLKYLDTF